MESGTSSAASDASPGPELSLVMPCYNEEEVVERTLRDLFAAFEAAGRRLEIVAVDNGSRDRTGAILAASAERDARLVAVSVEVNRGYGHGVLAGLPHARAPWIGILCADGQVSAEDVAALFALGDPEDGPRLLKVRRRFRRDGLRRKFVSILYNGLVNVLYPGLGSIDVNGNPKILPREAVERMDLRSTDWFLDAEIVIKARSLLLPVVEVDVVGHARGGGKSNVRASTCLEFVRNLVAYRFGGRGRVRAARRGGSPGILPVSSALRSRTATRR
jgi:glycosyltransferase involved in cell wall biosynthesis